LLRTAEETPISLLLLALLAVRQAVPRARLVDLLRLVLPLPERRPVGLVRGDFTVCNFGNLRFLVELGADLLGLGGGGVRGGQAVGKFLQVF
jgi:hypothetical protein